MKPLEQLRGELYRDDLDLTQLIADELNLLTFPNIQFNFTVLDAV